MAKRVYKKGRQKARSSYETAKDWYREYVKGAPGVKFLSEEQFQAYYKEARFIEKLKGNKTGNLSKKIAAKLAKDAHAYYENVFGVFEEFVARDDYEQYGKAELKAIADEIERINSIKKWYERLAEMRTSILKGGILHSYLSWVEDLIVPPSPEEEES